MQVFDVVLPIELKNNNTGRGFHWSKTNKERQALETTLVLLRQKRKPFDHPVSVLVTRILGKGQSFWDSSSILRGNYKELEDALVVCGWFHDDNTKWITNTFGIQDGNRRKLGRCVRIQCFTEFYPPCPTRPASPLRPTKSMPS
mgnify:FL=1|tara:strand:+ start:1176 stop:1607 length:432 start_codon:yes stop_codon:yes gene_type:complete